MPATQTFADVIGAWLERSGKAAYLAAPDLGLSQAALYNYLSGKSVPPNTRVADLARHIGHSAAHLTAILNADRRRLRRMRAKGVA